MVSGLGAHNLPVDSSGDSHDDGEWIRPGAAGRSESRREDRPEDPYDDGSFVRAVPREEPPPGRPVSRHADPYATHGREQLDDHFEDPVPRGSTAHDATRLDSPRHDSPRHDSPRHDIYDGYGYGDDDQREQGYAVPDPYADAAYARDSTRGGGGSSPFATGWLPLWPTIGIAVAAVILAFIIGNVTAGGGGSNTVASTVTTAASTTTTSAAAVTATVQRGDTLSAFYTSNVEFYLFGDGTFPRFVENLARLPRASHSAVIRSVFGGFNPVDAAPGYYSASLLQTADDLLAGYASGRYRSYYGLISAGRAP